MTIAVFFLGHWFTSLFSQTFFLHRYTAHKMFSMNKFWERIFYFGTWISQGSSYLNPRAYGIMHRMHHAFSDTEKDPHSPHFFKDVISMMMQTYRIYTGYVQRKEQPAKEFQGNYPEWPIIDKLGNAWVARVVWGIGYGVFYFFFATEWWQFLLLPAHFFMGPVHGAIVNWCGHKYGYRNYPNDDHSKNSIAWDFFLMGELFQNNHHKHPNRPNFATRWFEIDPTYPFLKLLHRLRIIQLRRKTDPV